MKNITLISGSPRKAGNSSKIIDLAESFFSKNGFNTNKIKLSEINISPCSACDFCKKNNHCNEDEEANKTNNILTNSDAIIIATPVYFGGMSGQLKCLLDKTLPLRRNGFLLKGKIGAVIATGGSRNGGQELTINSVHAWMLIHAMVIVGDNAHFGGTVQSPLEKDEDGKATINGTFNAVWDLLKRIK